MQKKNKNNTGNGTVGGGTVGRIMIVDDHPLVCKGLQDLVDSVDGLTISAVAGNADEALRQLEQELPSLLVLDLSLPGIGGLDLLKDVHIRYPELPVLVLSMYEENVYAERVLHAGAKGYIMKSEPPETVITAIRTVLGGDVYASPNQMSRFLEQFAATGTRGNKRNGVEALADRELEIFTLIGEGLSTKEIAVRLKRSPKTVQSHREHIKDKLGLKSASELVHAAMLWKKGVN